MVTALILMNVLMGPILVWRICGAKIHSDLSVAGAKQVSMQLEGTVQTLMSVYPACFPAPRNRSVRTLKVAISASVLKATRESTATT